MDTKETGEGLIFSQTAFEIRRKNRFEEKHIKTAPKHNYDIITKYIVTLISNSIVHIFFQKVYKILSEKHSHECTCCVSYLHNIIHK